MAFAICGNLPYAFQVQAALERGGTEVKFFVEELLLTRNNYAESLLDNLPLISFFEFKRLINAGELDGLVIALEFGEKSSQEIVQLCKFNNIPNVYVTIDWSNYNRAHLLNPNKAYIGYLEANIIDGCDLNCKGCCHFSPLFSKNEVYPLEDFERDICQLSKCCDVMIFRFVGGEPFLLKNLDEYIKIAQHYMPRTNLRILTNALHIPSLPQKILNAMSENNVVVDISPYAPTMKIADKIKATLETNKIAVCLYDAFVDKFFSFLTLHPGNDTKKSRVACVNDFCRILRNGKIYKCPVDALKYRFEEHFGIEGLPAATGIDIYAPNFSALLHMLDGDVEMCGWCAEQHREFPWKPTSNPKLEDWLADPDELKNFM